MRKLIRGSTESERRQMKVPTAKEQAVSWILEHRGMWRGAVLTVLLVAITGPWFFDLIMVPAEYPCSPPYVRVNDNFCGSPLSGIWLVGVIVTGVVEGTRGLVTGAMPVVKSARLFLGSLVAFLRVLPFFSTLLLIARGDGRRRQVFNLVAWGLAAGVVLLIGIFNYPSRFWVLWGIWLYVGVAAAVLILESLMLGTGAGPRQGSEESRPRR